MELTTCKQFANRHRISPMEVESAADDCRSMGRDRDGERLYWSHELTTACLSHGSTPTLFGVSDLPMGGHPC